MCIAILFLVFGLIGLGKGEFKVTSNRIVRGDKGRILGLISLVCAVLSLVDVVLCIGGFILLVVLGFMWTEKVDDSPQSAGV